MVANGAAILSSAIQDPTSIFHKVILMEVISNTVHVGVRSCETHDCVAVLKQGTPLPATGGGSLITIYDSQERIGLPLYEGESRWSSENTFIGELTCPVPAQLRGVESAKYKINYSSSGVLSFWCWVCISCVFSICRYRVDIFYMSIPCWQLACVDRFVEYQQ